MLASTVPSVTPPPFSMSLIAHEEQLVRQAILLLEQRLFQRGPNLPHPEATRQYLQLQLAGSPNEVFAAVFLDAQHRVLAFECLFQGSIDGAAVYPRVVLQRTLAWNAAAVIFCHNHPSGCTQCSAADRVLTTRLKEALAHIDVRVLDHVIVGEGRPFSFSEAGLL